MISTSVFLFLCLHLAFSKLSLIAPEALTSRLRSADKLDHRVGYFGKIHYGAHLFGHLKLGTPIDACQSTNVPSEQDFLKQGNVIAIVRRGGCSDKTKLFNVEKSGAKMVIFVDDQDFLPDLFGEQNNSEEVIIPSILISKPDGERIIEFLQKQSKSIFISMSFPTDSKKATIELDFWMSSSDKKRVSFAFLKEIKDFIQDNSDTIIFTPHYITWTCGVCRVHNFDKPANSECLSGGRYCAPDPDFKGPRLGRDVVLEDLRRMCIWTVDNNVWWEYVMKFEDRCLSSPNLNECSIQLLKDVSQADQLNAVLECFDESFIKSSNEAQVDPSMDDNTLLHQEKELQTDLEIISFPILYINQQSTKNLQLSNLNHLICKELKLSKTQCSTYFSKRHHISQSELISLMIIITSIVFIIFLLRVCSKRIATWDSKSLSLEANNQVNKYFRLQTLQDDNSNNASDSIE